MWEESTDVKGSHRMGKEILMTCVWQIQASLTHDSKLPLFGNESREFDIKEYPSLSS